VFQVAVAIHAGRILDRQRLTRRQFERFIDTLGEGTDVIMESCGTSHDWGRRMQSRSVRVRLLPVQYVRPYVRRNKTDRADTDALLEAARCGDIRSVPVTTIEQQTLQAIHRVRTQWQTARVARLNAIRGLLAEHGHAIPVGARTVLRRVTTIITDPEAAIPEVFRQMIALVVDEVHGLEEKIAGLDRQLAQIASAHPVVTRLQTIPGVGVLTATALVGSVGHIHAFRRGREFASWLG
jgi:transposase